MATRTVAPADQAHPVFARIWTTAMRRFQPQSIKEKRAQLARGLHGVVVEVGCGSGSAFPFYPAQVTQVTAIEPEPYLRAQAQEAAKSAPVPVEVVAGTGAAIPAADDSADAVVCSLVLCSVPDQAATLAEIARVL
ncbi:MAG: class I SAM-dependent methyltransferase, partial [Solirubrobacteraceae bacterium]|nr:class I SAM-dependent methyltransferase [Solirubrobacteraceae bacterium]